MSKVKIYTLANVTPELIYPQYESIKKFVKDEDVEFIVLNNTSLIARKNRKRIKEICKELGIKCPDVRFRSLISGASYITGYSLTWLFHRFLRWDKDTIHCMIDSDMFFIKDFSFNEYLADHELVAVQQRREHVEYLWNGILFMRSASLKHKNKMNFRPGNVEGVRTDCGGRTYYWLKANPDLDVKWLSHTWHNDVSQYEFLPENLKAEYDKKFNFQFIEDFIIHYRGASNWGKSDDDFVKAKKAFFDKFMNEVLNNGFRVKVNPDLYITKE